MTFIEPLALLALVLIPLLVLGTLLAQPAPARRQWPLWVRLTVRGIIFTLLVLALAGPQLRQPSERLSVVFLVDRSDSITAEQRQQANMYVQQALNHLPVDARAGLVAFGEQALVQRMPGSARDLPPNWVEPGGSSTDIGAAMNLGLGLLPSDGQRRLVLLSDGGDQSGQLAQADYMAAARGIALDVVSLAPPARAADPQISRVEMPTRVRHGQRPQAVIHTNASTASAARLLVRDGERLVVDQQVQLAAGAAELRIDLPEPAAGFHRYHVTLETPGDGQPQNNQASAYSVVQGPAQVLLVEGQPGESRQLGNALQAANFAVTTVTPGAMPTTIEQLSQFEATVLVNVPVYDLPLEAMVQLPAYVRELGHGLAMIGGNRSFGTGGYAHTPLEEILPVTMDVLPQEQTPAVGLVVLLDVSSSMSLREDGVPKIELAKEGITRIASQLRDDDELTIIPFDNQPQGIVGPFQGRERERMHESLGFVDVVGSGILMQDGLTVAAEHLRASTRPVRHLITLSDGDDTVQQGRSLELVTELNREGITVTSIALGSGKDIPFIRDLVTAGGGRFFLTEQASDLPTILTNETQLLMRPYLTEGQFVPSRGNASGAYNSSGLTEAFASLPPLYGYVATTPKQRTQVVLATPRGDPLLAVWQHGLGHTMAWTADLKSQWGRDWVRSQAFVPQVAALVNYLLPEASASQFSVASQRQGNGIAVLAQARNEHGERLSNLHVVGTLIASDGSRTPLILQEAAPGSYTAQLGAMPPDVYEVQVTATNNEGAPVAVAQSGVVVANDSEYRGMNHNLPLLERLATNGSGRFNPPATALSEQQLARGSTATNIGLPLLWVALLLWPLDVLLRRWGNTWVEWLQGRSMFDVRCSIFDWRRWRGSEPNQNAEAQRGRGAGIGD